MSESKFEILTSTESVIGKLKDYLKLENIEKIEVYCSNFSSYIQEDFSNPNFQTRFNNSSLSSQIFSILKKYRQDTQGKSNAPVEFHTFQLLTEENILNKINSEQEKDTFFLPDCNIKVIASSEQLDIFVDFLKQIIEQIPSDKRPEKFSSISTIVELFLEQTDKSKQIGNLNSALNSLKNAIIRKANELKGKEGFDFDIQGEIDNSFSNLTEKIKSIEEGKDLPLWKSTIVFFVEVLPLFFEKKPSFSSYKDFLDALENFSDTSSKFIYNKYKYAYSIPLFQILATDIVPALTLLTRSTLKEEIKIETNNAFYFLDYSNFNTSEQNHPFYFHLSYAIAICFNKTSNNGVRHTICPIIEPKDIPSNFEFFSKIDNTRISLFFSPYFNSYKATTWIKDKEKENSQSNQNLEGKNYLILSQCPTKSNAGLSEWLIQKLGYEVKDSINRTSQSPKLTQKPEKHNPVVDYSKYEIQINAKDNQPFVLSLSPFVFIDKSKVPQYKESFWSFLSFYKSKNEERRSALYIESFFRQEGELDDFLEKEEEKYLQVIDRFRNFLSNLYEQKYHIQPQYLEPQTTNYQICKVLNVLSLILLLETIQENYSDVKLSDDSLKINDNKVVFFDKETFFTTNNNPSPLTSIQDSKHPHILKQKGELIPIYVQSSDDNSLSLEYFTSKLKENKKIQTQELYEKVYSIVFDTQECEKESIKQEYGEVFLGFIQTFIDAFPFSFVLQDSQSLAPKLLDAILASPYANKLVKQFDETLEIKERCFDPSYDKNLYQLLSEQKYDDIPLDRELDKEKMIKEALDEVAKEIPKAFIDITMTGKIFNLKLAIADFLSSLLGTFAHSIFVSLAQSINTEFENQKRAFETLLYSKFTDKNNAPLALKREEGVYYPIAINQTLFNFSFSNYILGGRLCSGGMGDLDTNFYIFDTSGSSTPKINALQKIQRLQFSTLFMFLCLDELRNREAGKREEDQSFFKQNHSEKEFINYILDLEKEQDLALYESYGGGSKRKAKSQGEAIKSYQVIMQYFSEIQTGILDTTTKDNDPNPKKHREAIRALDNIGKNNIRGLYVGISNEKEKEKRPKLIGRLATTIIMKDGLWIG